MFVGHVAVMTQVVIVTHSALPANTTQSVQTANVTRNVLVTHTCHSIQQRLNKGIDAAGNVMYVRVVCGSNFFNPIQPNPPKD